MAKERERKRSDRWIIYKKKNENEGETEMESRENYRYRESEIKKSKFCPRFCLMILISVESQQKNIQLRNRLTLNLKQRFQSRIQLYKKQNN